MEPRAHHVLIGMFTAAMSSVDEEFDHYEVVFNETVNGLSKASAVQYSGIRVGDVSSLALDPLDPRKVRATIRVISNTPVKQDTHARLTIASITGGAVIQLQGGSPESPALTSPTGELPVIVADPSPLSRLMDNGEDLMGSITHLLEQANALFSQENVQSLSSTLHNLQAVSASAAEQRDALHGVLVQVSAAGHEATELLKDAKQLLTGPAAQNSLASAEGLLASLQRSSAGVEQLLEDNQAALNNGMQGLGAVGPAIDELRETLGVLRSFAQRLEEDPAGYLLRSDSVKEFRP
jgi:phospholipid/cholesterol/gamma-HCH transport system substrate-binding protein